MDSIRINSIILQEVDRSYAIPDHVHIQWQLYCVLSGGVKSVVGGTPHLLGPNDVMLVAPGVVRDRYCHGRAPTYLYANFINNGLTLNPLANRKLTMPPELLPDLTALAQELRTPGQSDTDLLVNALLVRILIGLVRHVSSGQTRTRLSVQNLPKQDELVRQVEAYLRNNLSLRITREDIAGVVHLCPTHLARVFRARTGKTLIERLTELRLQRAADLLRESTMPVTAIGYEIGFNSFSHFTRLFRKRMGLSPSDYRSAGGIILPPELGSA